MYGAHGRIRAVYSLDYQEMTRRHGVVALATCGECGYCITDGEADSGGFGLRCTQAGGQRTWYRALRACGLFYRRPGTGVAGGIPDGK